MDAWMFVQDDTLLSSSRFLVPLQEFHESRVNGSFPLTKTKMPGINTPIATTQCSRANRNIFPEPAHTSSLALHTQLNISHLTHPHPIDRRLEAAKSRGPQVRLYRCRGLRGQLCMAKVQVLARLCHCHQGHFGLLCRSVVRFFNSGQTLSFGTLALVFLQLSPHQHFIASYITGRQSTCSFHKSGATN